MIKTEKEKRVFRPDWLVFAVILLMAVSCLIFATFTFETNKFMSLFAQGIGVALLAVAVVDLIWKFSGGTPSEVQYKYTIHSINSLNDNLSEEVRRLSSTVDLIEKSQEIGLYSVCDHSANFGGQKDWLALLEMANTKMDAMGRTLYDWTRADDEFDHAVMRQIENKNVMFRWLIMSVDNQYIDYLEEEGVSITSHLRQRIPAMEKRFRRIRNRISDAKKKNLQVRQFKSVSLHCNMMTIDDHLFFTPYLHHSSSGRCPFIGVKGLNSPWYNMYDTEFEKIWADAEPIEWEGVTEEAVE